MTKNKSLITTKHQNFRGVFKIIINPLTLPLQLKVIDEKGITNRERLVSITEMNRLGIDIWKTGGSAMEYNKDPNPKI